MTKSADKKLWFKAKRYGWGWGIPQTWQGWVSFGVFIAVWLAALLLLLPSADSDPSTGEVSLFVAIVILDVLGLVYVSFKHGEAPKWR